MKYDVLGLGNPLIDIIVNIDESILKELNLEKGSMNLVDVKRQQEILNKCKNIKRNTALGGSCANTMSMIAQLGGRSAYGGKLGFDELGKDYESQLISIGTDSFLKKKEGTTGSTIILVTPDAERTMNTHLGMCVEYSKDDLSFEAIENSEYIYVEGYLWDTPKQKEAVVAALEHAKAVGTKISLTLSDSFCVERHKDDFQHLMDEFVDLLFCNEAEAGFMSDCDNPHEQLKKLSSSVDHIVLTMGRKGSRILNNSVTTDVKAFDTNPVDSTGAGDSFAAGYLFGITNGYSEKQAGTLASYCASIIVNQLGPRYDGDFRSKVRPYIL